MENKESWVDIKDYEGFYQISTLGNIKSLDREYWNGSVMVPLKGKLRKARLDTDGYRIVNLNKAGKKRTHKVSVLMGIAFFDYKFKKDKMVMDHINNIKTDDRRSNLQKITTRLNTSKDRKNKSSKYTGVSWSKANKAWVSRIRIKNEQIQLIATQDEDLAGNIYKVAITQIDSFTGDKKAFRLKCRDICLQPIQKVN